MSTVKHTSSLETDDAVLDFIFQSPGANGTIYAPNKEEKEQQAIESAVFKDSIYVKAASQDERDMICANRLQVTKEQLSSLQEDVNKYVAEANSGPDSIEKVDNLLTELLTKHPKYIPALNVRSQIRQFHAAQIARELHLILKSGEIASTPIVVEKKNKTDTLLKQAMEDLNTAISIFRTEFPEYIAFQDVMLPTGGVAPPRFFIQSCTQRGMLHDHIGNRPKASSDLTFASNLGSAFARQQLISMNPVAQLNSETISEIMEQLKTGKQSIV